MDAKPGDKVQLKVSARRGKRGIVEKIHSKKLVVRLSENDEQMRVDSSEVTNFSLAARKAWQRMPARRVGRPKGSTKTDRISVTLRIDRDLWERFRRAEVSGLVEDRTAVINSWIAKELTELGG